MSKYLKKIIVVVLITLILIAGIIILKVTLTKKTIIQNYKTYNIGELIISVPENEMEKFPVIFIFGGINYATPEWMFQQVPKELLYHSICVFCSYKNSFENVFSEAFIFFSKNNFVSGDISLIGFSAGAINVQNAYSDTLKFIGLIDPSTSERFLNLSFNENSKMVFNDANWSELSGIQKLLPSLAEKIKSAGGDAEKVNLKHDKIPKYFFEKYLHALIRVEN